MEYQEVLDFWFGPMDSGGAVGAEFQRRWFQKDSAFDQLIREKFAGLLEQPELPIGWGTTAQGYLAAILVYDQFARNIYRDQPRAFAFDHKALECSRWLVQSTWVERLSDFEKYFALMPYMHVEDLAEQTQGVQYFHRLWQRSSPDHAVALQNAWHYALRHREIILRFGRFPHRNAILGRSSSVQEGAFLKLPGSSF